MPSQRASVRIPASSAKNLTGRNNINGASNGKETVKFCHATRAASVLADSRGLVSSRGSFFALCVPRPCVMKMFHAPVERSTVDPSCPVHRSKTAPAKTKKRCRNGAEKVQFSRRKEAAIERRLAEWELWLTLGHEAFDRHQRLRPHQWLSLTTVARLFDVASQLDRLAAGMKLQPGEAGKRGLEDHSVWARDMDADLRRAYGSKAGAAPSEMTPVEMPKPDNAGEAMCLL